MKKTMEYERQPQNKKVHYAPLQNGMLRSNAALYVMLIPLLVYLLLFVYKPMWGLQIAFKDYSLFGGLSDSAWVGFDNFKTFLTGPYFGRLLKNTILIGFYG